MSKVRVPTPTPFLVHDATKFAFHVRMYLKDHLRILLPGIIQGTACEIRDIVQARKYPKDWTKDIFGCVNTPVTITLPSASKVAFTFSLTKGKKHYKVSIDDTSADEPVRVASTSVSSTPKNGYNRNQAVQLVHMINKWVVYIALKDLDLLNKFSHNIVAEGIEDDTIIHGY